MGNKYHIVLFLIVEYYKEHISFDNYKLLCYLRVNKESLAQKAISEMPDLIYFMKFSRGRLRGYIDISVAGWIDHNIEDMFNYRHYTLFTNDKYVRFTSYYYATIAGWSSHVRGDVMAHFINGYVMCESGDCIICKAFKKEIEIASFVRTLFPNILPLEEYKRKGLYIDMDF